VSALAQVHLGQKTNAGNTGLRIAKEWLTDATDKYLPNGELVGRDLLDKAQAYELQAEVRLKLNENVQGPQALSKAVAAYQTLAVQNRKTRMGSALAGISRLRTRTAERERRRLVLAANAGHQRCQNLQQTVATAISPTATAPQLNPAPSAPSQTQTPRPSL
jgi:hypothetical protein